MTMELNIVN